MHGTNQLVRVSSSLASLLVAWIYSIHGIVLFSWGVVVAGVWGLEDLQSSLMTVVEFHSEADEIL